MLITTSDNSNLQLRRSKTGEIDRKNLFLLSRILSITGYLSARPVSLSLTYTLQHNCHRAEEQIGTNKSAEIICGYIDKESGYWSDKGCFLLHTNASASTCHCNHTTNFAILMQVRDVKITAIDQTVLSIITYIGCSVSLLTQLITVTVFVCVGTLNSERVYVHRNLCFAIIASQVAFLSGIRAVENKVLCSIVAMILHYFYTAMFVWMLVEGMHLYSKVVRVFSTERSRVIYYCGFGWGVPLVLVTISATADWEGYGNGKSCWLSTKTGTIWAFVGPAIAIILVNIVILAMVVKVVMSSAKLERNGEFDHIRVGVKGAMFLLPLLGLTWLFGLLAVNEDMIVFQYLFAIFNSLQGFFIFLFHCAFNLEVRQALSKMRERRILQRGDFVSLSNGNSDGFQKTRHRHQSKPQRTYRKKRVSSVTSDQTTSWSPKHSSVSSRSSTQSTEVRETDDVVVQDLTLPEENFALQYI
ncbi:adhesion G-protein coupled receptor D1-like [Ylistrum balloti]|uniref:adhesion G-protein coupled receptor D1-like n=1 Tax=Ylistrum balloti TaxID=509963 RepID=UPI002905F41C|nr:adhesion G-protein coupled receptor D1-like [Ylistrum balloti]